MPCALPVSWILGIFGMGLIPYTLMGKTRSGPVMYGHHVCVEGDFIHTYTLLDEKEGLDANLFSEEVFGKKFSVSVDDLPKGNYVITLDLTETYHSEEGLRIMQILYLDEVVADDVDIIKLAGGKNRELRLQFYVTYDPETAKGPLALTFIAKKDNAKLNVFQVEDSSGKKVAYLKIKDLPMTLSSATEPEANLSISKPFHAEHREQMLKCSAVTFFHRTHLVNWENLGHLIEGAGFSIVGKYPGFPRIDTSDTYFNSMVQGTTTAHYGDKSSCFVTVHPRESGSGNSFPVSTLRLAVTTNHS
ncbi:MAG: hypothetical protein JW739_08575 [Opitutales bacterium]|nr:hypothetical protein [Opitutales bacterium]